MNQVNQPLSSDSAQESTFSATFDLMQGLGRQARVASTRIALASCGEKDAALHAIADALQVAELVLLEANQADIEAGKRRGLDAALLERLTLDSKRIAAMSEGCRQIALLPDPIGEITDMSFRPSGIQVGKMRVPLGVIGIIYESRPNVTIDAAVLCVKSGNAAILRGGSEAIHSNQAIATCISQGLETAGLPAEIVQLVPITDRAAVDALISMPDCVDIVVPRGGKGLIQRVSNNARVPVIKHLDGICHVYIDAEADLVKAHNIALNSKTHRYGVCNAMETLLVHESVAHELLPPLARAYQDAGVELRVCDRTQQVLLGLVTTAATDVDWQTEYLAPVLAIRIVDDFEHAIAHIAQYGSAHTDSIVTENITTARRFMTAIDSASVMVNASTRFADGFEYGLGAEIGISTDKLHARGPVGLEGLTSQKYVVIGDGHIRE